VTEKRPVVFIVDDDASVRESLADLLRSVGLEVKSFASAQEFLADKRADGPACLVLDVRLPGASGLEFQRMLAQSGVHLPIIFITGYGDVPMSVQAIKSGAVEFLTKPVREQELLDAIHSAIARDRDRLKQDDEVNELQVRFNSLTSREREVLALVVTGLQNKQIAGELDLSESTVKVHRGQITRKLRARTLVQLVRIADKLGLTRDQASG
jgi:FixJ family two-component response regulator